ncbi:IS1182 family transposase [Listeria booriae]|nr:IS1182 family transposase [Listeria booriae]
MYINYNMDQLILPMDLETMIPEYHVSRTIHQQVEAIPEIDIQKWQTAEGRPSYHPKMMLKVILYAYSQGVTSGRKIASMTQENIPMMWLAGQQTPSYRTINRARISPHFDILLKNMFVSFHTFAPKQQLISGEKMYVDGTKIEANANKYSFVWRKSSERFHANLQEKISALYEEMKQQVALDIEKDEKEDFSIAQLEQLDQVLSETIEALDASLCEADTVHQKTLKQEKRMWTKQQKQLQRDYLPRLQKYHMHFHQFGDRNSFSKTDVDATFMRMKEDHMRNGQLKAGYNVQIATENQFTLHCAIYQRPTDTRCLLPFLSSYEKQLGGLPNYIVADAGYGGEENYKYILEETDSLPVMPYTMYRKEQKRSYKKNVMHRDHWEYRAADDFFICPNQRKVNFQRYAYRTDRYGYVRDFKVYECEDCSDCPLRTQCTTAKSGKNRKIFYNPVWEELKQLARQSLTSETTATIYRQRKIDVEPVFGHVKALLGFTRFRLRGLPKVATEANLYFMANNMRKLARLACLYGKNTYPKSSFRFWIGIFLGQRTFCLGLFLRLFLNVFH